jgi:hypothetical protein
MVPICIIGCGISGMLLLLALEQSGIPPHHICIIDPYFDGGDLQRIWTTVLSNTPWSKLQNAIRLFNPNWKCPLEFSSIQPDELTPVYMLAKCIRQTILPYLQNCKKVQDTVSSIDKGEKNWTILCSKQSLQSQLVCVATGMKTKEYACDIPQIPLSIALHKDLLTKILTPFDSVLVFGTSHSGTIVLRNLQECKIPTTAIYKHKEPFYFDRDGHYDGIKEEAAKIADDVLAKNYNYIDLVSIDDTLTFIKKIRSATWVISAIGFESRNQGFETEGPGVWKFGAAFPPTAPDGIHKDISVLVFANQVQQKLPEILEAYQRLDFHTSL